MSTERRQSRYTTGEYAALLGAIDDNGRFDPAAYEAQRLIHANETIDGIDADALVRDLKDSPAFTGPDGKTQVQPLVEAINSRLDAASRAQLAGALATGGITDPGLADRARAAYDQAHERVRQAAERVDQSISDTLADAKRLSDGVATDPAATSAERTVGHVAGFALGKSQEAYGEKKGQYGAAFDMVAGAGAAAQFGYRYQHDANYRDVVNGAVGVYAAQAAQDPSKPLHDLGSAAKAVYTGFAQRMEAAQEAGKGHEAGGQIRGAVGFEVAMSALPVGGATRLAKLVRGLELGGPEAAAEIAETLGQARALRGSAAGEEVAENLYRGMAGIKRSQGELHELIDTVRKAGHMDDLLGSGALHPNELNYLIRKQPDVFSGKVPFEQSLEAWIGDRPLQSLGRRDIGDIGEALLAHRLVKEGYTDLMPIQNISGHGNDMVGLAPNGEIEYFEVKASVYNRARAASGDPEEIIPGRLAKAVGNEKYWETHNIWEQETVARARELMTDVQASGITAKWVRVNLDRDLHTGKLSSDMSIEEWLPPQQHGSLGLHGTHTPGIIGAPDIDEMFYALKSGSDQQLYAAMERVAASPGAQTLMKEAEARLDEQTMALAQDQANMAENIGLQTAVAEVQTTRGPVMMHRLTPPTMMQGPGGGGGGGDGGGGGGGGAGGGGGGGGGGG
ncbi:hypothetical protein NRY95_05570 [Xanthomonas campestris pv. phormiicola]|nr:hypothetical protein [Xanthomonas campestris pv. phormiicola]UYC17433.1 hypothetical protein NRY95_05570 [Xanthomonas campestris pv. phormiicola]